MIGSRVRVGLVARLAYVIVLIGIAVPDSLTQSAHPYWDLLTALPSLYKSYALRTQAQLEALKASSSLPAAVNYDPVMDAAMVTIPPFRWSGARLASGIDSTATSITLTSNSGDFVTGATIKIDNEALGITAVSGLTYTVTRAAWGTAAASHIATTQVLLNTLSLSNQVHMPFVTEDGHQYLTTWDAWYPQELQKSLSGLSTWKTYQFRRGPSPAIWFEVQTLFSRSTTLSEIGAITIRLYGGAGPNVTGTEPLAPQAAQFMIAKETWTRYWMLINQRAADWDLVYVWAADENRAPVQLINGLQVEATLQGKAIQSFQLEFNTSTTRMTRWHGDLHAWVRNAVMLKDPVDVNALLIKPGGGPPAPPPAPTNVKPIK